MKNIMNSIVLLAAFFFAVACYKDKGNYDYKDVVEIEISGIKDEYTVYVGTDMKIPVEITCKKGNPGNLSYEWRINGKIVSREKDLDIPVSFPVMPGLYSDFSVIDNETGIKTMKLFKVNVSTEFFDGWLILSDTGDHSELSYLRNDGKLYPCIYQQLNKEKLGAGATLMKEHWIPFASPTGEVFIAVSQGPNYSVDLDGNSLFRMVYTKDEFLGGVPADFSPQNLDCVINWDYMISNGKLYTRYVNRTYDAQYHEGFFVNGAVPGDYKLLPLTLRGNAVSSREIIGFDEKTKSYKLLREGTMSDFNYTDDPGKAFVPYNMNKTLVAGGPISTQVPEDYFVTFLKGDDGKHYVHRFAFKGWGNKKYTSISEVVFPSPELIRPDTKWAICNGRPYAYFSSGNRLYSYNCEGNRVKELKGSILSGKINALAVCRTDPQKLAVAYENASDKSKSDFVLLDISVIGDGAVIENTKKEAAFGMVVAIIYKVGNQWVLY